MSTTTRERRAPRSHGAPARHQPTGAAPPPPEPGPRRRRRQRDPAELRAKRTVSVQRNLGPAPTSFYVVLVIVAVLTSLGLVMVLSASSVRLVHEGSSPWSYFVRQLLWAVLGAVALVTIMRIPYQRWRRWVFPALLGSYGLMLLPFVPGIGVEVGGAKAWVLIGPIGFQPSEFLKVSVLLYCADLLTKRGEHMQVVRATLWPCLVVLCVSAGLMLAQGDLGSAIVLSSIVMAVAFIGGTPLTPLSLVGGAMGAATLGFVFSTEYRRERWTAFMDLAGNREHTSYQVWQALVGIADGGVTGVGIGASKAKWGFLPLAHSDFIFAIVAEELGLFGVVGVLGCYGLLAYFGVQIALSAADRFGMLLAGGVTAWLAAQAIINVGGVTGMMPLTGLTLPFVSFGGSSLLATMAAAGVLLSVARTSNA